jgi:hypothetical protein
MTEQNTVKKLADACREGRGNNCECVYGLEQSLNRFDIFESNNKKYKQDTIDFNGKHLTWLKNKREYVDKNNEGERVTLTKCETADIPYSCGEPGTTCNDFKSTHHTKDMGCQGCPKKTLVPAKSVRLPWPISKVVYTPAVTQSQERKVCGWSNAHVVTKANQLFDSINATGAFRNPYYDSFSYNKQIGKTGGLWPDRSFTPAGTESNVKGVITTGFLMSPCGDTCIYTPESFTCCANKITCNTTLGNCNIKDVTQSCETNVTNVNTDGTTTTTTDNVVSTEKDAVINEGKDPIVNEGKDPIVNEGKDPIVNEEELDVDKKSSKTMLIILLIFLILLLSLIALL